MLAKTPPMGWNTWNTFGREINDKLIRESADAFIEHGLLAAGYQYVVIDDCWAEKQRDSVTGKIVPSKTKFPHGMNAISDYVHSKGLKFGMYSCVGVLTCEGYPGSHGHEFLDAQTFAEYGCDYLKYDYCGRPVTSNGELSYRRMGLALKATGRDIIFSACNWGIDEPWKWMRSAGAHLYRSTGDIGDSFESYKNIAWSQIGNLYGSAPGCFNDMDMLTVGMYSKGLVGASDCTDGDYRSQFALWCLSSSPLMLGCDIRKITPLIRDLVTNKHLIRINQDEEARPPIVIQPFMMENCKVAVKHLSGGEFAFGFFNLTERDADIPCFLADVGLSPHDGYGFELTDVFTGENVGVYKELIKPKVPQRDCNVYLAKLVKT